MHRRPSVSIVIPTLNEEKYIEDTLISLQSQKTRKSYELIIADGKSEDKTRAIARKYVDKIVLEPKRLISAGRQKGVLAAEGRIIVSASADAIFPETWLNEVVSPIYEQKAVATVGKILPKNGNIIENAFSELLLDPISRALAAMNLHYASADNLAFTKSSFYKIGGFNTNLVTGEDTDFVKRVSKIGNVKYNPKAVAYVSMRRVRKWGYPAYLAYHTTNFLRTHLFGTGHKYYKPIR